MVVTPHRDARAVRRVLADSGEAAAVVEKLGQGPQAFADAPAWQARLEELAITAVLHVRTATEGALSLTVIVLVIVGYPVIWETLTRGRSPGKFALGLRVVSDDGGPERFRQALVRGLAEVVEIWLLLGCPALICAVLSARGKRLGDLFAPLLR